LFYKKLRRLNNPPTYEGERDAQRTGPQGGKKKVLQGEEHIGAKGLAPDGLRQHKARTSNCPKVKKQGGRMNRRKAAIKKIQTANLKTGWGGGVIRRKSNSQGKKGPVQGIEKSGGGK